MKRTQQELALIERVWLASIKTVMESGPLPENGLNMPAHVAEHCRLMRQYDPRLHTLTDAQITEIMAYDDPGPWTTHNAVRISRWSQSGWRPDFRALSIGEMNRPG
jgi:hypothetical protein